MCREVRGQIQLCFVSMCMQERSFALCGEIRDAFAAAIKDARLVKLRGIFPGCVGGLDDYSSFIVYTETCGLQLLKDTLIAPYLRV